MNISGLLALGTSEVVDAKTHELLGYAFAHAHGKGQLQRWILFRNPKNQFEIRPPSETMIQWSLEDWQKHVVDLWRPNAYYVRAQADVYEYGETYNDVTWKNLPTGENLPKPSFPDIPGSSFQLDYLDGRLLEVKQEDRVGLAYVVRGLDSESSIEYWVLPARYKPAGPNITTISVGNTEAAALDQFVAQCQSAWTSGATLVVTGCLNYNGETPPFAP